MKTNSLFHLGTRLLCIVILLIVACSPLGLRAQLVADGQSAVLDGVVTNIVDNVTVGTNGNFTLLMLTNGAAVSNSGTVNIGL
ncbi:MAG TPA: hypothetical protein VN761_13580, partial [Candidatus Polarisedimenticolia bacterium]|nr:hypothetical protein [Candidatus Polarisedimenticolia bacterium]